MGEKGGGGEGVSEQKVGGEGKTWPLEMVKRWNTGEKDS